LGTPSRNQGTNKQEYTPPELGRAFRVTPTVEPPKLMLFRLEDHRFMYGKTI
jgi:hypothetical protein